ncbi:MAG: 3-oxoacyl-[acyl-carrier-protein] synthase III C-terminal domain-containing protein [Pseudomonadota bacterium]
MPGIADWSSYLPRYRLPRSVIAQQWGWFGSGGGRAARGTRTLANWDEDALTMAVAAARQLGSDDVASLTFASTTAPFEDRSNAGLVAEACGLPPAIRTHDVGGSQRAATSALLAALHSADSSLITAADRRTAPPGSSAEWRYGDAAAALVTTPDAGAAEFVAGASVQRDFVDHYRTRELGRDYELEDRWVRDSGVLEVLPDLLRQIMDQAQLALTDIDHLVLPLAVPHARAVARALDLDPATLTDPLHEEIGETGAGHPLLMLAKVLDTADAGDLIALCGFGQGGDVLLLRVTGAAAAGRGGPNPASVTLDDYLRLPVYTRQLAPPLGNRGEADKRTAQSAYYRRRGAVNAMQGSRCTACQTPHFPPARICVSCGAVDQMETMDFSRRGARLKSFTEDWLAATPAPPLCYGNVAFDGGGNALLELTDVAPAQLAVGLELTMQFRIKDFDDARGFRRYFWKPQPVIAAGADHG